MPTGLEYLKHQSVSGLSEVARIIADSLPLEELIELGEMNTLEAAASAGSSTAQFKLGVWKILQEPSYVEGLRLLKAAAVGGFAMTIPDPFGDMELPTYLRSAGHGGELDLNKTVMLAARHSLRRADVKAALRCLKLASLTLPFQVTIEMAEVLYSCVRLAEESAATFSGLPVKIVQACLEKKSARLDYSAAYTLGRALCGIDCGSVSFSDLVEGTNYRKGAALLLRAADAGSAEAWLHLYHLHSNHELSVANPQMARFCLEKAARAGHAVAQRKLGTSILRESSSLREWEHGIEWLFEAFHAGDELAWKLMRSLVFPITGLDVEADTAMEEVARFAPWLAVRLRLSRAFGLTKLEALTVNPVDGAREWGLVVGQNTFISQRRMSAPRAIPALSNDALTALRAAAEFFTKVIREGNAIEGDLRYRAQVQRGAFRRIGLDEKMFFAEASSAMLEAVRQGPKWAVRTRTLVTAALAEHSLSRRTKASSKKARLM
ncbi:hypothetical protein [Piscinibacter koreensis]|uniref:Sel1 repeat family protein n=1 Tax=Piscinibacter koreensis TaxID=2742824 RepID=A0A7Y6NTK6_9BURK|nr:hypothetical protein [Schlegelella koreensis]NUZ09113.1 hypothetical protein [Schlegelella koreensis]